MKTLNEQIAEIVNENVTKATKRRKLLKLNLMPYEVTEILRHVEEVAPRARRTRGFDALALTFGVEIECYNIAHETLADAFTANGVLNVNHFRNYNHRDSESHYKIMSDGSIRGMNPLECVSPVLKGEAGENSLERVCRILNENGAQVNSSCGLHIHIGAATLEQAHVVRIVRNYQKLERAIDSFLAPSRRNGTYCQSLRSRNYSACQSIDDLRRAHNRDRYFKVNLIQTCAGNTIYSKTPTIGCVFDKTPKSNNFARGKPFAAGFFTLPLPKMAWWYGQGIVLPRQRQIKQAK